MRRRLLRAFWVIKIILCVAGLWQRTEQSNKTQAIWIFSLRHRQFVISAHYITTKPWMNLLGMSGTLTIKTGFKMCAQPPSTGVRLELISNASRSDSSLIWTLSGQRFPLPIKTQCAESRANTFTDLLFLLLAPHWWWCHGTSTKGCLRDLEGFVRSIHNSSLRSLA